jgi:hypothetical protein
MANVSEMALFSIMTVASAHLLWRYVWQVTEFFRLQLPTAGKGFWSRIFGQPLRCPIVHDAWVGTLSKLARQRLRTLLALQGTCSKGGDNAYIGCCTADYIDDRASGTVTLLHGPTTCSL